MIETSWYYYTPARVTGELRPVLLGATTHLREVLEMLIQGVAFVNLRKVNGQDVWGGKTYEVYSHQGDPLGELSTADINYAIYYMKKRGRAIGKCSHLASGWPGFTLSWQGWLLFGGRRL